MPDFDLTSPVLFLVFNRPASTKQVFETIRRARPKQLFIAADGPRTNRVGEAEKCNQVRQIVMNVDWNCNVKTLFREKNLGCKIGVSSAIDWFFENVTEGIILEDDCLPTQSFFWFCQELLERYRDDKRVMQICGFNPLIVFKNEVSSYVFSKFGPIWGWASWARAWKTYDVNMSTWPEVKGNRLYEMFTDSKQEESWRVELFDDVYASKIDTWDFQWSYAKLINSGSSIIPNVNLIKNVGFGSDATHTKGKSAQKYNKVFDIRELIHPKMVIRNKIFDKQYLKKFAIKDRNLFPMGIRLIKKTIKTIIGFFTKKPNALIDTKVHILSADELKDDFVIKQVNYSEEEYWKWVKSGNLEFAEESFIHKKGLEFFFSYKILQIQSNDVVMDAAGGKSNYIEAVKLTAGPKKLYLTDHVYKGVTKSEKGVYIVGGDISSIHLDSESITKISCHHAFEHFQEDKDVKFIIEIKRLLKQDGIACIIPLFVAHKYLECWNILPKAKFDNNAELLIDHTATLPGADDDGHFARIYSIEALKHRIIEQFSGLKFEIIECLIGGKPVPNMDKNFGSTINHPLRALKITKLSSET